jgi:ABC-type Fe3+/spermidine/putrescine transport system ATPase subunit
MSGNGTGRSGIETMNPSPAVRLEGVERRYGETVALAALDLDIMGGEFLTLLGPSGCGKTTTLRILAGLVDPSAGRVLIEGRDVVHLPPNKRNVGMVFQNYALFPHLTVAENIAFGMKQRGASAAAMRRRVGELLDLIKLPDVGDRRPAELSGGQRQRVAIARAVAHPPKILLMDEPLGALDLKLRESMQRELRAIQRELGITTLYVTHDQVEAMTMSDRIVVMRQGRVEQIGSPSDIYLRPANRFVASFVGRINFLPGALVPQMATSATIGLRPEWLRLLPATAAINGYHAIEGRLTETIFAGSHISLLVDLAEGSTMTVDVRPGDELPALGDMVRICWTPDQAILLSDV